MMTQGKVAREVLVFQHMEEAHPAYIETFLERQQIPYRLIRGFAGEPIPQWHHSMTGLVFMGGVMSVNDELPWLQSELQLIIDALRHNTPILGHCLGGQLISKACGETISDNPLAEIGWHRCTGLEHASALEWLGDVNNPFQMFHWHYQRFDLPNKRPAPGSGTIAQQAQLLFSSQHCENQAYVLGDNVLAMQCHVEMTEAMVASWMKNWGSELRAETHSEQSEAQILDQLSDKIAELNQVAERLYQRWVETLIL